MSTSSPHRPADIHETGEGMAPAVRPALVVGRHRIPVVLPTLGDPRLKVSVTIVAVSVLGQTLLRFQVSVLQILVCVLSGALIEVAVMLRTRHVVLWPASAIQTGVSVAFVFRVSGTRHGDLSSARGLSYFLLVIALSLTSKYFLRLDNRPVFNPSNLGIACGLLVLGPRRVFSEHLWWAPFGFPILVSMLVIVLGAWWVLRQVHMIPMALSFLAAFLPLIGAFAMAGRTYYARWHTGPIAGSFYWVTVGLSPEVLIFVFFMMSDPQTAPRSARGRIAYGGGIGLLAGALIVVQSTEFGIKVALLASLVLGSALVPVIERVSTRTPPRIRRPTSIPPSPLRQGSALRPVLALGILVTAVFTTTGTFLLAHDRATMALERSSAASQNQ